MRCDQPATRRSNRRIRLVNGARALFDDAVDRFCGVTGCPLTAHPLERRPQWTQRRKMVPGSHHIP
jgi:hypothetical protein